MGSLPCTADARARVFGAQLAGAEAFCARLAAEGVRRGVIGPREVDRLWERHLLNCALIAELLPHNARVIDVGSGAGFPGIPLVLARPDLRMTLLEPMQRRIAWLRETVAALDRDVTVTRGRADERHIRDAHGGQDAVVSRALAPLDRVARWSLPLAGVGGRVVAIKGQRAASELADHQTTITRLGGSDPRFVECGRDLVPEPTTVITFTRASAPAEFHVKQPRRR